jgi:hypothetical protein
MRKLLIAFAAAAVLALAGGAEAKAQYGGRVIGGGAQFNRGFVPGGYGAGFGAQFGFNRGFVPRRPVFIPRPIFAPPVFVPRQRFFAPPVYGAGFAADPYCPPGVGAAFAPGGYGAGRGFNLQFSAGY